MTAKHTPGPWFPGCDGGDAGYQVITEDRRDDDIADAFVVCHVNNCMGSEAKANARLISASPDLLEACKAARNVLCFLHNSMPMHVCTVDCPDIRKYVDQLDAAIAKAT